MAQPSMNLGILQARALTRLFLGMALLLLGTLPRAWGGQPLAPGSTLRVVLDNDYPPFIFRGPEGKAQGILVDQWALWEQKTGIHVRLDSMDWAEANRRMLAGRYDVIDTLFETPERHAQFEFGPPYARIDVPIYFSQELSGISDPKDLEGFIVGAKEGDASIPFLRSHGVTHFQLFPGYREMVEAARDGRIKVFTVDKPPALYHLIKLGIQDRFRETRPLYAGQFHRAVRKGQGELLAQVQKGFDRISPEEYAAIEKKWYGRPLLSKGDVRRTALIASIILGVVGLLLLWIWVLRRMVARRTAELRAISANFTNGMFYQLRVDPSGKRSFTYLSGSVAALYGIPASAALADDALIYGRIHPEDRPGLEAVEAEAIRTLTPFKHDVRMFNPDGQIRWSSFTSRPRRLPDGTQLWDGLEYIITDRVRMEEALKASEAEFRSLVGAVPDLIFTLNREGDFLTVNTSSANLLTLPPEEVVGHNVMELLPGPLATRFKGMIGQVLDSGKVQELDYGVLLQGEERFFEARVAPASQERVIAVSRDITQARRMEEEQSRLQAQLQQSQKLESLGRLAGGIAHDMNNVLGAILAIASAHLERQLPGTPQHRVFDTITRAATRGGEMVRNLLNFARQAPVSTQELDLNALLREMTQLLERTTLARVRLDLDLDPGLHPILGDPTALSTSLMNLAVNSVDAMAGEGTLFLRTRNLGPSQVEVQVGDTGSGMAPEVLRNAMDPFFTTKEMGKGTGLGLSIVYSTVKAHQGEIELRSETGQGTWVTLRFPAAKGPAGNSRPEDGAGAAGGLKPGLRILLVDDDEIVNESIQEILSVLGARSATAASAEAAVALVEGGYRPEAVLMDVNMPGMGASGGIAGLRPLLPEVPIVLITGNADAAALDLVRTHPGVSLLPKPFSLESLRLHLCSLPPAGGNAS